VGGGRNLKKKNENGGENREGSKQNSICKTVDRGRVIVITINKLEERLVEMRRAKIL